MTVEGWIGDSAVCGWGHTEATRSLFEYRTIEKVGKEAMEISANMLCPTCGKDAWRVVHGVDPAFASTYNPGEFVDFICCECGHVEHEAC